MTMKYRSKIDILGEILEIANDGGGALKTKIMFKAFLSFPQLNDYLGLLTHAGMIELKKEKGNIRYFTTEKGKEFLSHQRRIEQLLHGGAVAVRTAAKVSQPALKAGGK